MVRTGHLEHVQSILIIESVDAEREMETAQTSGNTGREIMMSVQLERFLYRPHNKNIMNINYKYNNTRVTIRFDTRY